VRTERRLEGVLPVWKPADWTSHDVVARVRRLLGLRRIGHSGTLDPAATGVLPLCLGRATRLVEYLQLLPKTYDVTMVFGYATDTEDDTGTVVERVDCVEIGESDIRATILSFVGRIEQTPPLYSAVKVGGKRLYEWAREGKTVERKSRVVTVYAIRNVSVYPDKPYPTARFEVICSKGTYVRSLCTDIGRKLGVPATMRALVRTAVGPFDRGACVMMEELESQSADGGWKERLVPIDRAVGHFPSVALTGAAAASASVGRPIPLGLVSLSQGIDVSESGIVRVYGPGRVFIGLFRIDRASEMLRPEKIFTAGGESD